MNGNDGEVVEPVSPYRVFWASDRSPADWRDLAAGLRAYASECRSRSRESFERSDTDGFLSQWASDSTARLADLGATLADKQGLWHFRALFNTAGKVVSAREVKGRYGWAWLLLDEHVAANGGRRFVNESRAQTAEKRSEALRKKGFTVGLIEARGRTMTASSGYMQVTDFVALCDVSLAAYTVVTADSGTDAH